MTTYSTKELAKQMGVTTGTAIEWGEKLHWTHKKCLYSSGWIWEVSTEQLQEFFTLKLRSYQSVDQKRENMCDMLDKWDLAFFGKTFPRTVKQIDLSKWRIAYTNRKDEEPERITENPELYKAAPPCSKEGCNQPKVKNSYGTFYAYCRDHHNELQRVAGRKHREKKKALMNALIITQQITQNNCKNILTI